MPGLVSTRETAKSTPATFFSPPFLFPSTITRRQREIVYLKTPTLPLPRIGLLAGQLRLPVSVPAVVSNSCVSRDLVKNHADYEQIKTRAEGIDHGNKCQP